jgi:hypothetical protein
MPSHHWIVVPRHWYHERRSAGKPGRQHPFVGGADVGELVLARVRFWLTMGWR